MERAGSAGSRGVQSGRLLPMATVLTIALTAPAAHGAPLRDAPPAEPAAAAAARSIPRYNGTIGGLDSPFAVAVNHLSRKIYVTEPKRNRVVVFDRLGRRRGTFGAAILRGPTALAFDFAGNLAVVSAGTDEIVFFRPSGRPIARTPIPAAVPLGLAFEPVSRRLLISDTSADAVWTSADGGSWRQERPAGLTAPAGAAAAGGSFFVVSSTDTRLMELSGTGTLIRALPLRGARRPLGVTIAPFGNGLAVSSADGQSGLFGRQIGGPLESFGARRMTTPILPGSECTRVLYPDFTGDRVVAFDLPESGSCTQGLALRGAGTASGFRRIIAPVVAENDSRVVLTARVSVPAPRGRPKRYRLRPVRTSLTAGIEKKLRLKVPGRAAAGIRQALRQRRNARATLVFAVRNRAGDRRRVIGRLVYSARTLRGLAASRRAASLRVRR